MVGDPGGTMGLTMPLARFSPKAYTDEEDLQVRAQLRPVSLSKAAGLD